MDEKIEKVRVMYLTDDPPRIVPEFDDWIVKQFEKLGYRRWASGCDRVDGWRDLAFDKTERDKDENGNK